MYSSKDSKRINPAQTSGKNLNVHQIKNALNDISAKTEESEKKNKALESLKFIDLDTLTEHLKEDTIHLDRLNNKIDPSIYAMNKENLIGSEGIMRKWIYRNKSNLNESDFFAFSRTQVDTKDILKVLKTSDPEEAIKKFFTLIKYFDAFFGKLMEFQMMNILRHENLYKQMQQSMPRKLSSPINLESWNIKSVIELMQYNADRQVDLSDFVAKINKNKKVFDADINLPTENEKLVIKLKDLEDQLQKLKDENLELKQTMVNTSEQSVFNMEPNKAQKHLFDNLKFFYKGILDKCFNELNILRNDVIERDIYLSKIKTEVSDLKTQVQFLKEQVDSSDVKEVLVEKMEKESTFEWALREECQRVKQAARDQLINLQQEIAKERYETINQISNLKIDLEKALQARKFLLNKLQIYKQENNGDESD